MEEIEVEEIRRFVSVFTERRIELIKAILDDNPCSIRELAEIVDRDIKNVFEDLMLLHKLKLIDFVCEGRRKRPVVRYKKIIIKLG